ncbi:(2Fe-2S)-binding protein [Streptomyces ortus]|uniref:(2Fe-2S)-binding protein n=1 Tax=Streptomyces ortus TaxID=2867268 RepID=A0ABT3VG62_9ACTN|nr:(2Fe-2S)-binding protein [Streptomyces ortus]MCX4237934.1 (2Fe-2S)-binding protein [Streptomyces ortus]
MNLDPDLDRLAALEGFFALRTGLPRVRAGRPPLPTLAEVYATAPRDVTDELPSGDEPDPLGFRVRKVVRLLAAPEARVGVSVAQQGLAARLWSVALGAAVLYGRVPDLDPALLRWDADGSAPDDLWLAEVRALPGDAATIRRLVHDGHLEPLSVALRARHPVAAGLLRGNAASALASTARLLDGWAAAHGRTDVRARVRALTADLLGHPDLRDTGDWTGTVFRRRSCCLYYRVPGGGVCGDCCFTKAPRSSPTDPSG